MDQLVRMFSEVGLPPHGFCLLWDPAFIWLHATSDIIIGLSYYAIPLALALQEPWQIGVLAAAALLLFAFRRGVVMTLLLAAAAGLVAAQFGAPLP